MRKSTAVAAILITGLLAGTLAIAEDAATPPSSTRPPQHLKKIGDRWTPWESPEPIPQGAYIIQKGDTLWDLSEKWLKDPHLWPQIWDQNRYVLDSHWIYPGDPLNVPNAPTVVPKEGVPPGEEQPPPAPETPPAAPSGGGEQHAEAVPQAPKLLPVADASDLYCSGYIEPSHSASAMRIAGREMERVHVAQGDVVYLNQGSTQGVQPGSEYQVIRISDPVEHPVTHAKLGTYVRRLGKVRVLAVQENTSTALITMSCLDVWDNDELVAWEDLTSPVLPPMAGLDRYDVTFGGGALGYIVETRDRRYMMQPRWLNFPDRDKVHLIGTGSIIHTDLAAASGVKPGSILTLYRENGSLPRLMLGRAIVVSVGEGTSTAKVVQSFRDIRLGDRVELR